MFSQVVPPRRAVILTGPGFQDHDVIYTYYRLIGAGFHVDVATKGGQGIRGKYGVPLPMDKLARPLISFEQLSPQDYDVVICTGGHEAPDRVRQERTVLAFVKEMAQSGRVVAGLCHGPWIMISAGVLRGKTVCAYVGMVDDMRNAGTTVIENAQVVTDGNIITCSYYAYVEQFMLAVFQAFEHPHPSSELTII